METPLFPTVSYLPRHAFQAFINKYPRGWGIARMLWPKSDDEWFLLVQPKPRNWQVFKFAVKYVDMWTNYVFAEKVKAGDSSAILRGRAMYKHGAAIFRASGLVECPHGLSREKLRIMERDAGLFFWKTYEGMDYHTDV